MNNQKESELLERIKDAANQRQLKAFNPAEVNPFRIVGGSSKDFYGAPLKGEVLSTKGLQGVLSYEPSELYITVFAGTPLSEVELILAEKGQYLAFEAPNFNGQATIGGAVASGLSGPARATSGGLRDYVLGLKMVNGRAEHLSLGGQVMKNVAGYDVSRVLCGSWGTLGLITEISLKVLPKALAEQTIVLQVSQQEAIDLLNAWGATSLPLNASVWHSAGETKADASPGKIVGELWIRLRGAVAAVRSGEQKIIAQCQTKGLCFELQDVRDAQNFWLQHKNQDLDFYKASISDDECLWRISVPQKTPELIIDGVDSAMPQCLEWHAGQRWLWAPLKNAEQIKTCAAAVGGHATLWRVSKRGGLRDKEVGVFAPLTKALLTIQKSMQREFDPWGLFDTGRLEI